MKPDTPPNKNSKQTLKSLSSLSELLKDLPPEEEPAELSPQEQLRREKKQKQEEREEYQRMTHQLASIVGFLIGVPDQWFQNPDYETMDLQVFEKLQKDEEALIFRMLCRLRSAFQRNYGRIVHAFRYEYRNIGSIPDLVPQDALNCLQQKNITFFHSRPEIDEYIIDINRQIHPRVRGLKRLMPEWLRWEYMEPLFDMPGGLDRKAVKAQGQNYLINPERFPYHCWVNWDAVSIGTESRGNILWCDEKLVNLLYERHEDRFEDLALVRDVGRATQESIDRYLSRGKRCVFMVDCENSDPTKLAAALSSLTDEQKDRVAGIVLIDSKYTTPEWNTMLDRLFRKSVWTGSSGAPVPVRHLVVNRLLDAKSQVDIHLTLEVAREINENHTDSIVLVASDSDYWALIQYFHGTRFMLMMEREKSSPAILSELLKHEIPYCFLDDFCTASTYSIRSITLLNLIQTEIDRILRGETAMALNPRAMLDRILAGTWIQLTTKEKNEFCTRYLDKPKLSIAPDGQVELTLDQPES